MNPAELLLTIILGYFFFLVEEFEASTWIAVASIVIPVVVTIPLSIFVFRRSTGLAAFTVVTSAHLLLTAVLRVSLVYGGIVTFLRGVDAFGMLGLNPTTYLIFAASGVVPAYFIRKYDPGPGFRFVPIVLASLGVLYTYKLSSGFFAAPTTVNGLLLLLAELTAPAVYAIPGVWTARYWSRSFRGIGRRRKGDGVVLMLVSGWIYEWDAYTATLLGGSGVVNDVAIHDGVLYEAMPAGVISWQTGEPVPTASDGWATSICSHAGKLYHAVATGPSSADRSMILETLTGEVVAERERSVTTLCSHDGRLYDGGSGGVHETLANREVTDRQVWVLCSHAGKLYDGGIMGVHETISGTEVASRRGGVLALCSYRGALYDAAMFGEVCNTMDDVPALHYRHIVHRTRTRVVVGIELKGGRREVEAVAGMVPVAREIPRRFGGLLRRCRKAVGG